MAPRSWFTLAVGAAALVVLVASIACSGPAPGQTQQGPPAAQGNLELTKVEIATARDAQTATQLIIANAKGLFKKRGLDEVTIKYFSSGGELIQAMAGKSIHMGTPGGVPSSNARAGGVPIKVLAPVSDVTGPQKLVVKPGITKPQDLYGKKVGLLKGTTPELFFQSVVQRYGLDAGRIETVNLGPTEMVTAFSRGDLHAVFIWQPHALRVQRAGGNVLMTGTTSFMAGQEGPQRLFGDYAVFIVLDDFLAKNPRTIRAMLAALADATVFVQTNFDESAEIVGKELNIAVEDLKIILSENKYTMIVNQQFADDLNKLADFLHSRGVLKQQIKMSDAIDVGPMRDVRPEWVTLAPAK